ncbi:MAG: hypothetical protein NTX64_07280, partial [Elusimicrobia bacterium]|nr:hypothetical protein [Elusimicrobiota bacterium]
MTARGATFALLSALAAAAPALGQPDGRAGPPAFDDDGPRPGMDEPRRGPPPQIFMACVGLPEEAACVFPTPEGPVKGTCVPFPNGKLACLPPWKRRPPEPRRGEIAPLLRQEPSPAQFQRQAEQSPVAPLPAPWTEAKPPETKQSRSPAANPVLPLPPKAGEGRAEGESPPRPRPLVRALILLAAGAGLFALYKRLTTKAAPPAVAAPAPAASLPQPAAPAGPTGGKLIAKNYEIRREIGLGGMGVMLYLNQSERVRMEREVARLAAEKQVNEAQAAQAQAEK